MSFLIGPTQLGLLAPYVDAAAATGLLVVAKGEQQRKAALWGVAGVLAHIVFTLSYALGFYFGFAYMWSINGCFFMAMWSLGGENVRSFVGAVFEVSGRWFGGRHLYGPAGDAPARSAEEAGP